MKKYIVYLSSILSSLLIILVIHTFIYRIFYEYFWYILKEFKFILLNFGIPFLIILFIALNIFFILKSNKKKFPIHFIWLAFFLIWSINSIIAILYGKFGWWHSILSAYYTVIYVPQLIVSLLIVKLLYKKSKSMV